MTACFHCGLDVPAGATFSVDWNGEPRALCCRGCFAVVQAIIAAGLDDYYRLRAAPAHQAADSLPPALRDLAAYDLPAVQRAFVRSVGDKREATLILEGITCAACVWLNERNLRRLPGVSDVRVNYATRRAQVTWDDARLRLSDILAAIRAIGYSAHPYDPARSQALLARERRALLRRLGVAGIFGAQIMTFAVALYVGDWSGSDLGLRTFFYWVSGLLALPILGYSAQPFLRGAWLDLRRGHAGMDVPIAAGMIAAFGASAWTTVTGAGVIYFDSIAMFAFFLLAARTFELSARARAAAQIEAIAPPSPAVAHRVDSAGAVQAVPVADLQAGDMILVRPGETIPADGTVVAGQSSVNESLVTGESLPVPKTLGAAVIGGAINAESPLTVRVERVGADTVLSQILRLLDRAQAEKPRLTQVADRVAAWFVVGMLAFTALVGIYWWQHDPARVPPIVIAVLVVTCPCALGLATPAALAAATGAAARSGVLTTRGHAMETLARADHFVFDKTGTLTRGELRLNGVHALADLDAERCLAAAAALERHSEHPIARAIVAAAPAAVAPAADITNTPGGGIRGNVGGIALRIGTLAFIEGGGAPVPNAAHIEKLAGAGGTVVLLATEARVLAAFVLKDSLRPGAAELIADLRQRGNKITLVSGDRTAPAHHVARALGIEHVRAELGPGEKLAYLERLQADGDVVAMIGDGVNDAPVLAAAPVSIAMGSAATVSAASADMLLLAQDLRPIATALAIARRTTTVIRQNLAWAIAYNLLAVPAAAAGLVTPWMAALGMSASSALVVANALRLTKVKNANQSANELR
ncbi:MAG TPA: heavy metal translocating P-type ATPase [Burkholderiales bacterium]